MLSELGNPLCTLCPLHQNVKNICVMGNGSIERKIMIIGEAPGANEDEQRLPFVGRAGQMLNQALEGAGLKREEVYVTNMVKCRPSQNRRPELSEIRACSVYLVREYKAIEPIFVLLLGNTALHGLTNVQGGISKHRGYVNKHHHAFVRSEAYATYHPSAALYSKEVKEIFMEDVRVFGQFIEQFEAKVKAKESTGAYTTTEGDDG